MAPRKRTVEEQEPAAKADGYTAPVRVTRSSTRRAANANSAASVLQSPKPKAPAKKKARVEDKKELVKSEEAGSEDVKVEDKASEPAVDAGKRTLVIEHWWVSVFFFLNNYFSLFPVWMRRKSGGMVENEVNV